MMRDKRRWILYPAVGVVFALLMVGTALARRTGVPLPLQLYGGLTVGTDPAPVGLDVEAMANGSAAGSVTTQPEGQYADGEETFLVVGEQTDIGDGTPITFTVEGVDAEITYFDPEYRKIWGTGCGGIEDAICFDSEEIWEVDLKVPVYTLTVTSTGCAPIYVEYTPSVGDGLVTDTVPISQTRQFTAPRDTDIVLTADASAPCCAFDSWVVDGGAPITDTQTVTVTLSDADREAVASSHERGPFTLTVGEAEGGEVTVDPDQAEYDCGTTATLTATADVGWTFDGWTGDVVTETNPLSITLYNDTVVTPVFALEEYTLTAVADPPEGGSIIKDPDQATYHYGDVVTVTAVPTTGWEFVEWSGALSGVDTTQILTMTGHTVITATFQQLYTLTVTSDGCCEILAEYDGITETVAAGGTEDIADLSDGTVVTLTAQTVELCSFQGWTVDGSPVEGNPIAVTMDGDKEAVAACRRYTIFLPLVTKNY